MSKPVLELQHVQKEIRGRTILEPLSYSMEPGQVLALCGGNGAGKSTLLRMIAGITQPSSGTIKVDGRVWRENRAGYAAGIGYMPDDFQFGYALTAGETLDFYAALRGIKDPKRTDEVLEEVGLLEVKRKRVSTFSKGMRQRLLFGQALLAEPVLLVLDEPTNGLDPYWMQAFVRLVRMRKERGQSVVFSTHNLEVAELTADHIVLLHEGKMVQSGTAEHFRELYGTGGLHAAFSREGDHL